MIVDKAKEWLLSIAIKKMSIHLVNLLISWLISLKLENVGVTVNQEAATAAIFSGLEILRNWLKQKYGLKFL